MDKIIDAVNCYFGDKTREKSETLDGLLELQDEVQAMIDCLTEEIENG